MSARDFDLGGGFQHSGSYPLVFQHSSGCHERAGPPGVRVRRDPPTRAGSTPHPPPHVRRRLLDARTPRTRDHVWRVGLASREVSTVASSMWGGAGMGAGRVDRRRFRSETKQPARSYLTRADVSNRLSQESRRLTSENGPLNLCTMGLWHSRCDLYMVNSCAAPTLGVTTPRSGKYTDLSVWVWGN